MRSQRVSESSRVSSNYPSRRSSRISSSRDSKKDEVHVGSGKSNLFTNPNTSSKRFANYSKVVSNNSKIFASKSFSNGNSFKTMSRSLTDSKINSKIDRLTGNCCHHSISQNLKNNVCIVTEKCGISDEEMIDKSTVAIIAENDCLNDCQVLENSVQIRFLSIEKHEVFVANNKFTMNKLIAKRPDSVAVDLNSTDKTETHLKSSDSIIFNLDESKVYSASQEDIFLSKELTSDRRDSRDDDIMIVHDETLGSDRSVYSFGGKCEAVHSWAGIVS